MILTQPTFTTSSGTTRIISTVGSLAVGVFTGTIVERQLYVGVYTFKLLVNDELTPFTTRAEIFFDVEISNC